MKSNPKSQPNYKFSSVHSLLNLLLTIFLLNVVFSHTTSMISLGNNSTLLSPFASWLVMAIVLQLMRVVILSISFHVIILRGMIWLYMLTIYLQMSGSRVVSTLVMKFLRIKNVSLIVILIDCKSLSLSLSLVRLWNKNQIMNEI